MSFSCNFKTKSLKNKQLRASEIRKEILHQKYTVKHISVWKKNILVIARAKNRIKLHFSQVNFLLGNVVFGRKQHTIQPYTPAWAAHPYKSNMIMAFQS